MSDRPEGTTLQVNIHTPGGTLLNVYAKDGADLSLRLGELEEAATQIAALEGVYNAARLTQPAAADPVWAAEAPAKAAAQADGATPACDHGPRKHKSGFSKAGKPWSGWFCTQPRGMGQCEPKWD